MDLTELIPFRFACCGKGRLIGILQNISPIGRCIFLPFLHRIEPFVPIHCRKPLIQSEVPVPLDFFQLCRFPYFRVGQYIFIQIALCQIYQKFLRIVFVIDHIRIGTINQSRLKLLFFFLLIPLFIVNFWIIILLFMINRIVSSENSYPAHPRGAQKHRSHAKNRLTLCHRENAARFERNSHEKRKRRHLKVINF
jgi:hypothetical protein